MKRVDFAGRAQALVGTRFRAQGRGVEGLDCIGLALEVYGTPVAEVRCDYQLRGDHEAELSAYLTKYFRKVGPATRRPGDLLLIRVAADQLHVAVSTGAGFVHAHAGLRRVVETPGTPEWPVVGIYRRRAR